MILTSVLLTVLDAIPMDSGIFMSSLITNICTFFMNLIWEVVLYSIKHPNNKAAKEPDMMTPPSPPLVESNPEKQVQEEHARYDDM